jgi:hypothetical protein
LRRLITKPSQRLISTTLTQHINGQFLMKKKGKENMSVPPIAIKTPLEQAQEYDVEMRALEIKITSAWYAAGSIGLAMRNSNGWELLGHHSFNAWLMSAAPKSRSVVYAAVNALEELSDVPAEDLKEIAHSTVHVLKKLPKEVRSKPEVRKAAKDLTTKEFTRKMRADHPELHLEEVSKRAFRFSGTQNLVVDEALEAARLISDSPTDEEALLFVCIEWLDSKCSLVDGGLTNRQALESSYPNAPTN